MAKLTSIFQFSGSLDGLSVYTAAGIDHPIVRKKGGPSKEKLQTTPSCVNSLKTGGEFGGRSLAASGLREALLTVSTFADGSFMGRLNKLLAPLQQLDKQSPWGQRQVLISQKPHLLEGLELARFRPFDAVLQNGVGYTLSRDLVSARVEVPHLLPGINLTPRASHPYFRVIITLGVVPDMLYDKELRQYQPAERFAGVPAAEAQTGWLLVKSGAPATTLEILLPTKPLSLQCSLVLAIGIDFGTPGASGAVESIKQTGSARILAMA